MPKILVVRFSSLGDVILTTPVYKNLKIEDPKCKITVAVKEKYAGVLERNPYIDEIIPLGDSESLWNYIQKIRNRNFDVLIDLHNNLRSRILCLFSGIPKIIRFNKALFARRLYVNRKIKSRELKDHTLHRYLSCLESLGIKPKEYAPEIFQTDLGTPTTPNLRILVVQTAFLGDAVLTTPIFLNLRQQFPTAKISLLCTPAIQDVFHGNKSIDEILILDKKGKDKGVLSFWRWRKRLKDQFDVCLLPHRSFRSAFLVWFAQIPKRIGFDRSEGRFFLTDIVHFDWESHDSQRNLHLLEALGMKVKKSPVEISVEKNRFKFDQFIQEHHISKNSILVGMNPGSVWKTKRWLPEYFAKVADVLSDTWNCKVILFGSSKDKEAADSVVKAMKTKAVNLCGQTDLKSLSYLISHMNLFITNDSGPMHLASALGIPVVAIFGPTTRELGFFPLGEKSTVVELDLSCRPCSLHGGDACPLGHFKCMKDLSPEMVLKECEKFLTKKTP